VILAIAAGLAFRRRHVNLPVIRKQVRLAWRPRIEIALRRAEEDDVAP
jgi:hypothetical protein